MKNTKYFVYVPLVTREQSIYSLWITNTTFHNDVMSKVKRQSNEIHIHEETKKFKFGMSA